MSEGERQISCTSAPEEKRRDHDRISPEVESPRKSELKELHLRFPARLQEEKGEMDRKEGRERKGS